MRSFYLTLPVFSVSQIMLFPLVYRYIPEWMFSNIVFYTGILAAVIIFFIFSCLACLHIRYHGLINQYQAGIGFSLLSSSFIALSFNIAFLVIFPVTLDRSVSTYLLETIQARGEISPPELEDIFIKDYIIGRKAVLRRIQEQEVTGNIILSENNAGDLVTVRLSPQGEAFLSLGNFVKSMFRLKDRRIPLSGQDQDSAARNSE